jgi:hypothetical protein
MDICFEIKRIFTDEFEGRWLNMGYVKSYYILPEEQTITIKNRADWEKCLDTSAKCLRYAKWAPL